MFIGKNQKPYSISELEISNVLNNDELLSLYSMSELDTLYKKYFGNYKAMYPHILIKKIKLYDSSDEVNSFIIDGQKFWLDKATRVGLMHLANCSTDDLQLVLGDKILTFPVEFAKDFLMRLEVYAGQCYLQTQKHLLAVKELKTVEDILNYDYTTGYPEKITLE
jgi:hypothetical protein